MTREDKDMLARLIIEYGDMKAHIGAYLAKEMGDTSFADMVAVKNQLLDKIQGDATMTREDKDMLARLIIEYGDMKAHIGAYLAKEMGDTSFADMVAVKNQLLDKILRMVLEC